MGLGQYSGQLLEYRESSTAAERARWSQRGRRDRTGSGVPSETPTQRARLT